MLIKNQRKKAYAYKIVLSFQTPVTYEEDLT